MEKLAQLKARISQLPKQPIVARLTQELEAATKSEPVRERLKATFVQIDFAGPQEFARRLDAETTLYGEIIRAAKIKLE